MFQQGDYSNSEYKQRFKEQIEVLEAYNGGFLFGNSPGGAAREIATLGLDAEIEVDVDKAQTSARGEYLATALLLSSDRRRYGKLIISLNNETRNNNKNCPKTLTDMYRLMVAFEPTRPTAVSGGRNEGMNFGKVAVEPGTGGDGDHGGFSATARKIECWRCGGGPHEKGLPETRHGKRKE